MCMFTYIYRNTCFGEGPVFPVQIEQMRECNNEQIKIDWGNMLLQHQKKCGQVNKTMMFNMMDNKSMRTHGQHGWQ